MLTKKYVKLIASPLLEPLSPPQSTDPLKIVHIRLHKLLQSVAEVSAVRDRSRKNFQSTGRCSSAVFFFCTHLRVVN